MDVVSLFNPWRQDRSSMKMKNENSKTNTVWKGLDNLEPRLMLSGDSVITFNEVMYNPAGTEEQLEWIELHNQTSVNVSLNGWRLGGGVDYDFTDTIIPGNGYLVVAKDPDLLASQLSVLDAVGGYTGQLSNSGERIRLFDHNDRVMDELEYNDAGLWPVAPDGSGVTLAKLNPHLATSDPHSWTWSVQMNGTPGDVNFVVSQPTVEIVNAWNVDFQGGAGSTIYGQEGIAHDYGPDADGQWNIFNVAPLDTSDPSSQTSFSQNPSISLLDQTGNASSVDIAFTDDVGGWSGAAGANYLSGDYLIMLSNHSFGYPDSLQMTISGLTPNQTYQLISITSHNAGRDLQVTADLNNNGQFTDDSSIIVSGGATRGLIEFTADVSGQLNIQYAIGNSVEANVSGLQIRQVETTQPVSPEDLPDVVFNEIAGASDGTFFVEIHNRSDNIVDLSNYIIEMAGTGGGSYVIDQLTLPAGGFHSFDGALLNFTPADEAQLFLYQPDRTAVIDAARIKNSLRGRSWQHDGRWQKPDVATPALPNSFAFHDEIVINEIMYHHSPVDAVAAQMISDLLLPFDQVWRYNQSGVDLGTTWAQNEHPTGQNDWVSGQGVLGWENATLAEPILTNLTLGPRTFYFETDFEITGDPQAINDLQLTHLIDDGAIFYLNGHEVLFVNMPAGPINASTFASPGVSNAQLAGPVSLPVQYLVSGTNRLSVEVHQSSSTSSDIVMGAKLDAVTVTVPATPFADDPEEWIELYNRSTTPVDLSNWQLDDAINFEFTAGITLNPGEYLVIARDATAMAAKYPGLAIAGEYDGKLSNSDEQIQLLDTTGNIADEVHYYDDGRWDQWADGGCKRTIYMGI